MSDGVTGSPRDTTPAQNQVGPHEFVPLRRWRNRGRCRACYLNAAYHPVRGWVAARPLGDKA
jgi:hypothetical protein